MGPVPLRLVLAEALFYFLSLNGLVFFTAFGDISSDAPSSLLWAQAPPEEDSESEGSETSCH